MPRVLLVEDNEMNRDMLSRRLIRRGFEVIFAVDGQQGIDLARSERPDIILMDMSLPGMNGWDATRAIRDNPEVSKTPIIAPTSFVILDLATPVAVAIPPTLALATVKSASLASFSAPLNPPRSDLPFVFIL